MDCDHDMPPESATTVAWSARRAIGRGRPGQIRRLRASRRSRRGSRCQTVQRGVGNVVDGLVALYRLRRVPDNPSARRNDPVTVFVLLYTARRASRFARPFTPPSLTASTFPMSRAAL